MIYIYGCLCPRCCYSVPVSDFGAGVLGVAIDGPTSVMRDNKSVQTNASVPTSQLGKKHNAICYHKVRENVAAGVIRVGWVNSEDNLADLFTKVLNLPTRVRLLSKMMSRWSKAGKW